MTTKTRTVIDLTNYLKNLPDDMKKNFLKEIDFFIEYEIKKCKLDETNFEIEFCIRDLLLRFISMEKLYCLQNNTPYFGLFEKLEKSILWFNSIMLYNNYSFFVEVELSAVA